MSFLNFDEIKNSYAIEDVAQLLSLKLTKSGNSLRGKCPVCESSGDRNLVITPSKKVYYCFSDQKGGDVIALVAHINGIGVKEAAQWLTGDNSPNNKLSTKDTPPSEGFKPLQYLQHEHDAVIALGFEPEDAQRLGIGYAPRGVLRGTVAVPVRLEDGTMVGYIGITEATLPSSWKW
ncbi:CHC2 zinc finger domain-containing protein [Paracoccaceae bacterium GXU_MW_L88]